MTRQRIRLIALDLRKHDFADPQADPRPTLGATALFNPMPVKPRMGGSPEICGQAPNLWMGGLTI
jgi:hypothetical protein